MSYPSTLHPVLLPNSSYPTSSHPIPFPVRGIFLQSAYLEEKLFQLCCYVFMQEGREYLKKSVSSWLPSLQKEEESLASTEHDMEEEEDQNKV